MSSCECDSGGGVSCERGQLAICRHKNGNCHGSCHTPPRGASGRQLDNFILSNVTGIDRSISQPITQDEMDLLRKQVYLSPDGTRVKFHFVRDKARTRR